MKLKIHIAEIEDFSNEVLSFIGNRFELTTGPIKDIKKLLEHVDIYWFRLAHKIDYNVISYRTRCKIIATPVTGIDHIDEDLCKEKGIKIICLRGELEFLKEVRATAEHTILLTMMLMRNSANAFQHVKNKQWNRDLFRGNELYQKKVGILGLGRLGSIVADYFKAFGCLIGFYDTNNINNPGWKCFSDPETLVEWADIVSIHIPYNKANHNIYAASFFKTFTNQKWLINTSRGGVIDEQYLLKALNNKSIAGAALDVLSGEPDISQNELLKYACQHQNLIITPHIGGNTFESFRKTEHFIANKILEAIKSIYV